MTDVQGRIDLTKYDLNWLIRELWIIDIQNRLVESGPVLAGNYYIGNLEMVWIFEYFIFSGDARNQTDYYFKFLITIPNYFFSKFENYNNYQLKQTTSWIVLMKNKTIIMWLIWVRQQFDVEDEKKKSEFIICIVCDLRSGKIAIFDINNNEWSIAADANMEKIFFSDILTACR